MASNVAAIPCKRALSRRGGRVRANIIADSDVHAGRRAHEHARSFIKLPTDTLLKTSEKHTQKHTQRPAAHSTYRTPHEIEMSTSLQAHSRIDALVDSEGNAALAGVVDHGRERTAFHVTPGHLCALGLHGFEVGPSPCGAVAG